MSLVFRNALMPSEDQQALRLRLVYFMTTEKESKTELNLFTYGLIGTGCFIGVWILFNLARPTGIDVDLARASEAKNTLSNIAKVCVVKEAVGEENPTFTLPKLNKYTFSPVNGNCKGDANGLLSAVSENSSKYPTYSYNVKTGAKSCSHDGPKKKLHGCSARRNGEW